MTLVLRDGTTSTVNGTGASAITSAMTPSAYSYVPTIYRMITQGPVVAGNFGC